MISVKLPQHSSIMSVMTKAVVKASKGLLRDFSELENLQTSVKNNKQFVTSADMRSDKILREELLRARPTYSLISEEGKEIIGTEPSYRWIVDPLDGTVNYMHGLPHWAISVALEKNGDIVAAVTYDPVKNEMFWAEKGYGAYLNDRKIRVSRKRLLSDVLISFGRVSNDLENKYRHIFSSIRRTGSTTLNMAYLAAGRIDLIYSDLQQNIWDAAAGYLLIKEAGGVIADKNGFSTTDYVNAEIMTNIDLLPLAVKL